MKKLIAFAAAVALATPVFAGVIVNSVTDNGDGSTTYQFSIDTLNEESLLDMTIMGDLRQNPGGPIYEVISPMPWKPAVVFTSDVGLADALGEGYDQTTDTLVDDSHWPVHGKFEVDLDPAQDGSDSVRVVLATVDSGISIKTLPGGPIPLAQVTVWSPDLWITGVLQSESDPDGSFEWHIPEPSTLLLAGLGAVGMAAIRRRRR